MLYAFCIVMALLPSWLSVQYFVKNDKFPEPVPTLKMVFKHGVYSAGWVLITVIPISILFLDDWVNSDVIVGSAITAFGMAAIPEEFLNIKFYENVWRRIKTSMNRWMEWCMVRWFRWDLPQ